MSLSTALNIAQSSLRTLTRQTSVLSSNIANAQNADYTRRNAAIESLDGGVRFVAIRRETSNAVFAGSLRALSDSEAQSTIASRVNVLRSELLGSDDGLSLQSYLTEFQTALQTYSASPSSGQAAALAVDRAKDMAERINEVSASIQSFRVDVDTGIADAVGQLNTLLSEFEEVNTSIVNGTRLGKDVSDELDERDGLLKEISKYVPLQTMSRRDNDLVLMTRGGATLFETVPRKVTFDPSTALAPGVNGNPVLVDGVPLLGGIGPNTEASGQLAALVQLRDSLAPTLQNQTDEFARALVESFAEADQSGSGQPALAGLFTYSGGPALPLSGAVSVGIAGTLRVNALFDPTQGGNPALLRDGGANGAAYVENTGGFPSFADRILRFGSNLNAPASFDPSGAISGQVSVTRYAGEITGWLDGYRSTALQAADSKNALAARLQESLANETGVNIDEEMSRLLDLEHSYEASTRIISAVDEMLATLLAAVR